MQPFWVQTFTMIFWILYFHLYFSRLIENSISLKMTLTTFVHSHEERYQSQDYTWVTEKIIDPPSVKTYPQINVTLVLGLQENVYTIITLSCYCCMKCCLSVVSNCVNFSTFLQEKCQYIRFVSIYKGKNRRIIKKKKKKKKKKDILSFFWKYTRLILRWHCHTPDSGVALKCYIRPLRCIHNILQNHCFKGKNGAFWTLRTTLVHTNQYPRSSQTTLRAHNEKIDSLDVPALKFMA